MSGSSDPIFPNGVFSYMDDPPVDYPINPSCSYVQEFNAQLNAWLETIHLPIESWAFPDEPETDQQRGKVYPWDE